MPDTRNLGPKQRDVLLALERGEHALAWTAAEPGRGPQYVWSDGRVEDPRVVNSLEDRGLIRCEADHGMWLSKAGLEWVAAHHRAEVEALRSRVEELMEEVWQLRADVMTAYEVGFERGKDAARIEQARREARS